VITRRNNDGPTPETCTYRCEQDGRTWDIPCRSYYAEQLATWQDMPEPTDAEVLELAKTGRVHPWYGERELAVSNLLANIAEIDAFEERLAAGTEAVE